MYATPLPLAPLLLAQQLSILWWPGAAQSEASSEQCVVSSAVASSAVASSAVVGELESGAESKL